MQNNYFPIALHYFAAPRERICLPLSQNKAVLSPRDGERLSACLPGSHNKQDILKPLTAA